MTTNPRLVQVDGNRHTCEVTEWIVRLEGEEWRSTEMEDENFDFIVLRAMVAGEHEEGTQDLDMSWEKRYGLVLDWSRAGRMSQSTHWGGWLTDTDAPIH